MTPADFNRFRNLLGEGSGFQSAMYRQLEFLLGLRDPALIRPFRRQTEVYAELTAALAAPSLWDDVVALLARHGFDLPAELLNRDVAVEHEPDPAVEAAWVRIYADAGPDNHLRLLGEALTERGRAVRRLAVEPRQGGAAHHGRQGRQRRLGRTGLVAAQHGPGGLPGAVVGPYRDVTGERDSHATPRESRGPPASTRPTRATGTCSTCRPPTAATTPRRPTWPATRSACNPGPPATNSLADLDAWARLGVEGHLEAERPWLPYHELLTAPAARLVGARPAETVVMNSLTVNLHLLMVELLPPGGRAAPASSSRTPRSPRTATRCAARPASTASTRTTRWSGCARAPARTPCAPRTSSTTWPPRGDTVALVLLGGVNYLTGELLDIPAITAAGRAAGAVVGWDLAHAAGNVPLALHDWDVDFAAWCSYKYLNSGPGALAGVFVHERHLGDADLPRFEGWWSTEAATRFEMTPVSRPPATVEAWQISNPPIFAMGPVRTSLELFDSVGMPALRERSLRLTGYLERLLDEVTAGRPLTVITPRDPARRGCQLSVRIGAGSAGELTKRLRHEHGVIADAREPDVVRFAPVPLYSTYHDCWRAADALAATVGEVEP